MPDTEILPLIGVAGDSPRARRTDPLTSHAAADTSNREDSQTVVRAVLTEHGPLADCEILAIARQHGSQFSEPRLRTARHELVESREVHMVAEERKTPSGRNAKAWDITTDKSHIVLCEKHGLIPHAMADSCVWPHFAQPSGNLPSMTAVETLDPREAVTQ